MSIDLVRYNSFVHTALSTRFSQLVTRASNVTVTRVAQNIFNAIAATALLPLIGIAGGIWHAKEYIRHCSSTTKEAPVLRELHKWLAFEDIKQGGLTGFYALVTAITGTAYNLLQKNYDPNKTTLYKALDTNRLNVAKFLLEKKDMLKPTPTLEKAECEKLCYVIIQYRDTNLLTWLLQQKKVDVEFEKTFLRAVFDASPNAHYQGLFKKRLCISQAEADAFYDVVLEHGQIYFTDEFARWLYYSSVDINGYYWFDVSSDIILSSRTTVNKSPLTLAIDKKDTTKIQEILSKKYVKRSVETEEGTRTLIVQHGRAELYKFEMEKIVNYIIENSAIDLLKQLLTIPCDDPYYSFHRRFFSLVRAIKDQETKDTFIDVLVSKSKQFFRESFIIEEKSGTLEKDLGRESFLKIIKELADMNSSSFSKEIESAINEINKKPLAA